jgi:hypothetical protein
MAKHSLSNRSLFDLQAVSGLHLGLSFPDHAKKLKTLATRLRFTKATAALFHGTATVTHTQKPSGHLEKGPSGYCCWEYWK